MKRRRWPLTTLPVGQAFVAEKPPKHFNAFVHHYAARSGKAFRTRRVENGREVRRVA